MFEVHYNSYDSDTGVMLNSEVNVLDKFDFTGK